MRQRQRDYPRSFARCARTHAGGRLFRARTTSGAQCCLSSACRRGLFSHTASHIAPVFVIITPPFAAVQAVFAPLHPRRLSPGSPKRPGSWLAAPRPRAKTPLNLRWIWPCPRGARGDVDLDQLAAEPSDATNVRARCPSCRCDSRTRLRLGNDVATS